MTATRAAGVPTRVSWRLSRSGAQAACTVTRPGRRPVLEVRDTTTRTLHEVPGLGPTSQLLPMDDGSVLMCHHRHGGHVVERLDSEGQVAVVAVSAAQGLGLVDDSYALEKDAGGTSRLVAFADGRTIPVASVGGVAVGAVQLGNARVAVNVVSDGACSAVEVDTVSGTVEAYLSVSPHSDDQVVDYVGAANLLVVATNATGQVRLGFGLPGSEPVSFPDVLAGPGPATHLATSTDGHWLALCFEVGAVSEIRVVDVRSATALSVALPPLVVVGRGAFTDSELVVPVSTPDRPATLLHIDLASGRHRFEDPPSVTACRVCRLPGADGDIEAVVVGDPVVADVVLVALHGGPLSAWRAMFDPLLAELAAAGVAVVAPNVRGSTGYGRAHALAIVDDWGGPDLADVLAVGAAVTRMRPVGAVRPGLLGISYGAYLALLAAERHASAWSSCIALSPFLSGARVAAEAGPVAELVRRLGGTTSPDVRDDLDRLTVPVLVIHGVDDDVVPVAEAELLHAELRSLSRDSTFHALPDTGHDVLAGHRATEVVDAVVAFAAGSRTPSPGTNPPMTPREEEMT